MQGSPSSANDSSKLFGRSSAIFTPRSITYTVAGALVIAGGAMALTSSPDSSSAQGNVKGYSVQTDKTADTTSVAAPTPSGSTTSTSFPATTDGANTPDVHLTVNGQDIPVPANGSTQQTVTDSGGQTSVTTNSNVTSQGSANNSSSTSFSLNVTNSSSSDQGGTTQ
jgi:hypothetical protein